MCIVRLKKRAVCTAAEGVQCPNCRAPVQQFILPANGEAMVSMPVRGVLNHDARNSNHSTQNSSTSSRHVSTAEQQFILPADGEAMVSMPVRGTLNHDARNNSTNRHVSTPVRGTARGGVRLSVRGTHDVNMERSSDDSNGRRALGVVDGQERASASVVGTHGMHTQKSSISSRGDDDGSGVAAMNNEARLNVHAPVWGGTYGMQMKPSSSSNVDNNADNSASYTDAVSSASLLSSGKTSASPSAARGGRMQVSRGGGLLSVGASVGCEREGGAGDIVLKIRLWEGGVVVGVR